MWSHPPYCVRAQHNPKSVVTYQGRDTQKFSSKIDLRYNHQVQLANCVITTYELMWKFESSCEVGRIIEHTGYPVMQSNCKMGKYISFILTLWSRHYIRPTFKTFTNIPRAISTFRSGQINKMEFGTHVMFHFCNVYEQFGVQNSAEIQYKKYSCFSHSPTV